MDAAVERVKAIGGRVRREGAKIVAVQFDATPARDDDVEMIAALKDLEQLVLRGEEITDASAGHIASLAKLRHLALEGTRITDAGVEKLKQLAGLRRLGLRAAPVITHAARAHLAELPNQQNRELREDNIGDAARGRRKPRGQHPLRDHPGGKAGTDAGVARRS
ncbi:MAG: hypothetical protein QM844_11970, partial [Planctomycetota bacterium]|nr:hypothetical protein [Planctomycetota bacterium]